MPPPQRTAGTAESTASVPIAPASPNPMTKLACRLAHRTITASRPPGRRRLVGFTGVEQRTQPERGKRPPEDVRTDQQVREHHDKCKRGEHKGVKWFQPR